MHDGHILADIQQQRWRIEIPFPLHRFTTEDHFCPLLHGKCHFLLHALQRRSVDQRPHGNIIALGRIAKLHRFHRFAHTVHKAIVNALLHIHTLGAVTDLPGVNHAGVNNRFYRQLQIRIVHDDGRGFTAQLQAHFGNVLRGGGHDLLPRPHAAGHADQCHFRVARQLLAYSFAAPQHQVEDSLRQANLVNDFGKGNGVVRREFARFNDDGVTGQQRRTQLAGNEEEREVPRQNASGHAEGAFEQQNVFARAIALDNFAFVAACPLGHIVEIIGGESHFHLRELLDLATFSHDQGADFAGAFADTRRNFTQPTRALDGRQCLPVGLSALGGVDGLAGIVGTAVGNTGNDLFGGRVDHINPGFTLPGNKLSINIHRMLYGYCHNLLL